MAPDNTTASTLFSAGSAAAMLSWLLLGSTLFIPSLRRWGWRITGIIIPALLAIAYAVALTIGISSGAGGGFGSIAEVRTLFSNDFALTAGWIHYLAFDLVVGTWIARTGISTGAPRIVLLICMVLTFLVGPVGMLAFLLLRMTAGPRSWEKLA